jgi:hypothetical protein
MMLYYANDVALRCVALRCVALRCVALRIIFMMSFLAFIGELWRE